MGEHMVEPRQVLQRSADGHSNPRAVEQAVRPVRGACDVAELLLRVENDGDRIRRILAERPSDALKC
jgi:hypothetical protein